MGKCFALVMADKQWGGYTTDASALINAILNKEVSSSNVLLPDDSGNQGTDVNPSYFAPAYYRVFQTVTGQSRWAQVVDQTYAILTKCGLSVETIRRGRQELEDDLAERPSDRVRLPGGGRPALEKKFRSSRSN